MLVKKYSKNGAVKLNKSQKSMLKECLNIDIDKLIVMKDDGNLDLEETELNQIEQHCIKYLNLVYDIRHSIDERIQEEFQADKK